MIFSNGSGELVLPPDNSFKEESTCNVRFLKANGAGICDLAIFEKFKNQGFSFKNSKDE